jgi:hypothetical protein
MTYQLTIRRGTPEERQIAHHRYPYASVAEALVAGAWSAASSNSDTTIADVLAHPGVEWDWGRLSANPQISLADIIANPQFPWKPNDVSYNPGLTVAEVTANPQYKWSLSGLCANGRICTLEILDFLDARHDARKRAKGARWKLNSLLERYGLTEQAIKIRTRREIFRLLLCAHRNGKHRISDVLRGIAEEWL